MLVPTLDNYANWQYWFALYPQEPRKFSYQIFSLKCASDSTLEECVIHKWCCNRIVPNTMLCHYCP